MAGPPENGGRPGAIATAVAPESVGLEQCPNCAILLTRDARGAHCAVCKFPYDKKRPSRPPEFEEYLARLRRGDRRADAEELIDLAERFGLQWGGAELKPAPRRLLTRDDSGPAFAVQEASGSESYLVVVLGEAHWTSGLVHFFSSDEEMGALQGMRVRLRQEAIATLDGRGNLECQSAGKLQVVKRAVPAVSPAGSSEVAKPSAEIPLPPTPVPRRPVVRGTVVVAALMAAVLAILGAVWIARTWKGEHGEPPSPTPPGPTSVPAYSAPAAGSLEVRVNCPALGNLDGLVLPESKRQRSSVLRWTNQPARAHRLKVTCDGFEDHTQNVSLEGGEHTVLDVTLRRR